MKWLWRLESRYGRYAIRNLTLYIAALNLAVFLLFLFPGGNRLISMLVLSPGHVLKGEIWRLVTFVFLPETFSTLWIFFSVYLVYMIGAWLESSWGRFKLNLYYFTGMLGSIIGSFITYFVTGSGFTTGYYLNMSMFLAFATLFPETEFRLFFILPVKAKYLGIFDAIFLIYALISNIYLKQWHTAASIIMAFINYLLFFGSDFINWIKLKRRVLQNRKRFFDQVKGSYKDRYRKY
jgi:hypothetical protein